MARINSCDFFIHRKTWRAEDMSGWLAGWLAYLCVSVCMSGRRGGGAGEGGTGIAWVARYLWQVRDGASRRSSRRFFLRRPLDEGRLLRCTALAHSLLPHRRACGHVYRSTGHVIRVLDSALQTATMRWPRPHWRVCAVGTWGTPADPVRALRRALRKSRGHAGDLAHARPGACAVLAATTWRCISATAWSAEAKGFATN